MKKNPNFEFQNSHWRIHSQLLKFKKLGENFEILSQLLNFKRFSPSFLNFEILTGEIPELFEFQKALPAF